MFNESIEPSVTTLGLTPAQETGKFWFRRPSAQILPLIQRGPAVEMRPKGDHMPKGLIRVRCDNKTKR
jgi:hypothetical protein